MDNNQVVSDQAIEDILDGKEVDISSPKTTTKGSCQNCPNKRMTLDLKNGRTIHFDLCEACNEKRILSLTQNIQEPVLIQGDWNVLMIQRYRKALAEGLTHEEAKLKVANPR
jgi:hypothetical protein